MHQIDYLGINLNHYVKHEISVIRECISNNNIDIVLIGGLSFSFRIIESIINAIRNLFPNVKIILGGGIVTADPEYIHNYLKPDISVYGEGEITIIQCIKAIRYSGDLSKIKGILYYLKYEEIRRAEPQNIIESLDDLPYPDLESFGYIEYLSNHRPGIPSVYTDILDNPRPYPIIGSRSCPYKCSFCFNTIPGKYRKRSIDSIINELMHVIPKYKINIILFYDELFSIDEIRILELCSKMEALRKEFSWTIYWNCSLRVSNHKYHVLKRLRQSGCYMISYGLESYSQAILDNMHKGVKKEDVKNAINSTIRAEMQIDGNFIFGDPQEDKKSYMETLDYWIKIFEYGVNLDVLIPYPGSQIYHLAKNDGRIQDIIEFYQNINGAYKNLTKMSDFEYFVMIKTIFLYKIKNRAEVFSKICFTSRRLNHQYKCPHCQHGKSISNYIIRNKLWYTIPVTCKKCNKVFSIITWQYAIVRKTLLFFEPLLPPKYAINMLSCFLPV